MTDADSIIPEIISADLQKLYNLIEPIHEESPELKEAYNKLKKGIRIQYHIEWNLKGYADIRERQGIVVLNGKIYAIEEWWDEEEARRTAARKALMDYYSQEKDPYTGR